MILWRTDDYDNVILSTIDCDRSQIYVIYSVAVAEPGHGNVGPLVIGLTVWVCTEAGKC